MKTTNRIPTTGPTTTFQARRHALFAKIGTATSAPFGLSSGDFAGDPESYRHEGGRPGAKNNKPTRGYRDPNVLVC